MKMISVLVWVVATTFAGASLQAQTTGRLVSLNAEDTELAVVASRISAQAGMRVILAPGLRTTVTVSLAQRPVREAVNAVADATGLGWRRVMVPKDGDLANICRSLAAALSAPPATVLVEGDDEMSSRAVVSGENVTKLRDRASDLGLEQAYYLFSPAVPAEPATTPAASTAVVQEETPTDGADQLLSASDVYKGMTKFLSNLGPADALGVVERIRDEVVAAMSPYDRQVMFGEMPVTTTPRGPFVQPRPGRVRLTYPGGTGVYITPFDRPYYGSW